MFIGKTKQMDMGYGHFVKTVYPVCYQETAETKTTELIVSCCGMTPEFADQPVHKAFYWTAEMLMQAIDACENKWLKVAFHLAFAATVRIGELLGLTWDCVDVSEEAIVENRAYIFINKQVERVSRNAVDELDSKEVILIFPSQRKNNKTVRLLKTPKTDTSERKVYIPKFVAQILVDIKKEQDELKDILGSEYQDYNLVMATTFGLPIGDSYLRDQMQKVIDEQGLPDVVFHNL